MRSETRDERLLADPSSADEATARNYEIGVEHFSFSVVRNVYAQALQAAAD